MLDGQRLVRVELIDAALTEDVAQARVDVVPERRVARLQRCEPANGGNPGVRSISPFGDSAGQSIKSGRERLIVRRIGAARRKHG